MYTYLVIISLGQGLVRRHIVVVRSYLEQQTLLCNVVPLGVSSVIPVVD